MFRKFLSSCTIGGFSGRAQFHEVTQLANTELSHWILSWDSSIHNIKYFPNIALKIIVNFVGSAGGNFPIGFHVKFCKYFVFLSEAHALDFDILTGR
jgi:hypothetical protein